MEPDPEARLLTVLKRGLSALCCAQGLTIDPADLDPWDEPAASPQQLSPAQTAVALRAAYGA